MKYNEYRFITSAVSPFVTADKLVEQMGSKSLLDWEQVAATAGVHSIVQALYPAFIEKDVLDYIPAEFLEYTKHLSELNQERNLKLQAQLMDAVAVINNLGITPLLMKGAAHLFLDTFANISDRLLTDLDILVPTSEIERVCKELISSGYVYSGDNMEFIETHHHYPPLIKNSECASIELHRELMFRGQQHALPTDYAWSNSIDIILPNKAQAKVLNPTYRIFHSFLHSSLVDSLYLQGYAEIRQLHELARTYLVYASDLDLVGMQVYAKEKGVAKQLNANLYVTSKFMEIPQLEEAIDNNAARTLLNYYRICLKLKYKWFNGLDSRWYRRKKRIQAKKLLATPCKQVDV